MLQAEAVIQAGTDQGVSGRVQFYQSADTEPLQITGDGGMAPDVKTEMPSVVRLMSVYPFVRDAKKKL